MNSAQHSSRIAKLRKRFSDVLSGSVKLDPRGATLFLEGLCAQDDPVVCLDTIIESAHGLPSVQSAMQFDLSVQFMNGLGSTVLGYLLRASDVGGDTLDNLLFHIVEPPIFWGGFTRTFQQGALSEDAQLVFARTLSRLLTLQDRDTTPYRDVAARPAIQESLTASPKHEIREMGHLINHILSNTTSVTTYDLLHGPGGRHDNDFTEFCDIAILPTADEILCQKPPFLRTAFHDDLETSEDPIEDYLDHTFRMLREDMIFDIRQEVQAALKEKKKYRGLRVDGITMLGVYTGSNDRKTSWGIKLQCGSDFRQLKSMKEEKERVNFLTRDTRGSKILRNQSLICLASGQDIISFGTVNRVEELLARNPPVIVFQLDGDANIKKTLASLRTGQNLQLIQIGTATFAFEPVLSALKTCTVPLSEEILLWSPGSLPQYSSNGETLSRIANTLTLDPTIALDSLMDLPKPICLDKAQAKSLVAGLQQRVSLIQGPPGTGKSFIGAILAKAIHDKTTQTILVVCYTNHALDQFLCDLLEYDIPAESIVRLGGRPNQLTDHLSLQKQPRGRFRYDWGKIHGLKRDASNYERKLEAHFEALLDTDDKSLMKYLEANHHEFSEAFYVPLETEDGMTRVGPNGQDIDDGYLISRWTRGLDAGVLSDEPHIRASTQIWGMTRPARQELLAKWRQELLADKLQPICDDGNMYNTIQEDVGREFANLTVNTLQQKRIIACTTTGAAIYAKTIAQAGPEVLLVEEAGEILESHILTALSENVDQMILIGDHKQLRPKVNNYQLTVEKGEGFDLNRSLFERLVLKGYPHDTLSVQHRMRPEISAFVRELTYPELSDAPSTKQRPDIRGVQSNIIFVNHTHPEDDNTLIGDRVDGGTKTSKQNTYEVQMVLKIVRYLAQQGYKSESIVVLTPYLGQLHQLRDALKRDNDPVLNELDASDLARADLAPLAASDPKSKKGRIHLATIDNYQGEESDIVVASMTRSNKSNMIGFMDSPERLNVLLSRARDGLILIGNAQTFLNSKKGGPLWRRFFTLLGEGRYVYQGFPVKCERHPNRPALLQRAIDFDAHCPDGGCTATCGFTLECGHMCTLKCHPDRASSSLYNPHDVSQCKYGMSGRCSAGHHTVTWECRQSQPDACKACTKEAKRFEEIARKQLSAQKRREEEAAEHRRRMAELEAEQEAERKRVYQEALARRQRELAAALDEERKRLHQETLAKREQQLAEAREVERKRLHQEALAKREEELAAARVEEWKRLHEEAVAKRERELAEANEAERKRLYQEALAKRTRELAAAREQERKRLHQEALAEAREAERKRLHQEALAKREREIAEAREEEKKRLYQEAVARREQRLAETREENNRLYQEAVAKREQRMVEVAREAEKRRREYEQAAAAARAKQDAERRKAAEAAEPSRCTIQ